MVPAASLRRPGSAASTAHPRPPAAPKVRVVEHDDEILSLQVRVRQAPAALAADG